MYVYLMLTDDSRSIDGWWPFDPNDPKRGSGYGHIYEVDDEIVERYQKARDEVDEAESAFLSNATFSQSMTKKAREDRDREYQASKEKGERETYERLKAKYEGTEVTTQ